MSKKKIYGLRIAIGLMVFLFFKVTSGNMLDWELATYVSLIFTLLSVIVVFEMLDYTTRHLLRNYKDRLTDQEMADIELPHRRDRGDVRDIREIEAVPGMNLEP